MIMRRYLSFILLVNLLFWHVCVLGQEPAKPTDIQVEKAVLDAAKAFSSKYCKDFVSVAEFERFVKCKGKYSQAFLSYGLFGSLDFRQDKITNLFNDPAIGCYRVLGSFNSSFIDPSGKEHTGRTYKSQDFYDESKLFYETFNQYQLIPPVARKRAMEVYGPLNPQKVRCFKYTFVKGSLYGYCEIAFMNKEDSFPVDTRLSGSGILIIKNGVIVGFRLNNVEDRFSHYISDKGNTPRTPVSDYSYEAYYTVREGVVYPETIVQTVVWKAPQSSGSQNYFFAEVNPCLDPFANAVTTSMRVSFRDYLALDKHLKQQYSGHFIRSGAPWRVTLAKPSVDTVIEGMMSRVQSWKSIKSDLERSGRNLERQNMLQTERFISSEAASGKFEPSSSEIDRILRNFSRQDSKTLELYKGLLSNYQ